ncbi:cupin domain-containing protein [Leisingera thetidis]|uniref:cupin domain-containing protein n=1 Tax=Leisingera thetidis TaxID=2930199 RepID=UPI0021F769F0|nr:cupin domain-containing protein [Leisingera thetidis]
MTMTAYLQTMQRGTLESWGRPEDIGSETVEGSPHCAGRFDLGGPDGTVFGGVYSVTRGKYRTVYGFHEHATLLDGVVALTDETTGETVVYGPGDSWIIAKGTPVLWDIRSDTADKSFLAVTTDLPS